MSWKSKIRDSDCRLCSLHESAEHVCLLGSGPKKTKIMIVGEAPGAREDEENRAFVGPAGQLLDEMLEASRLNRRDVYITNVVKCRPPDNRTPEKDEIKTCARTYLAAEIQKVRPEFILALGNSALYALTGRSGITRHRGDIQRLHSGTAVSLAMSFDSWKSIRPQIFPTYHPAYILRSPQFRGDLDADFARFGRIVKGTQREQATKVRMVRTASQLETAIRFLMKQRELSYDIETYENRGYRPDWAEDAAIVSIAFSWTPGHAIFVPLYHRDSPFKENWQDVVRSFRDLLDRDGIHYIGHNGKYDSRYILSTCGIRARLTFDTMLAAHMLDENRFKGLDPLSQTFLGVGKRLHNTRDLFNRSLRQVAFYNGEDTDYALQLFHIFREQLKEPENRRIARVFIKLMMPASDALVRIEARGMWWDRKRHMKRAKRVLKQQGKVYRKITKYSKNKDINLNSPSQVGRLLFGELGLPLIATTRTGRPSTSESVLLHLRDKHPAVRALLEYREVTTYVTRYFNAYPQHADHKDRIHTNYKLFGTVTGRLSSDNPNLQQVPRNTFVRGLFGAPKGWTFVEADYSQLELRIIAWIAQEQNMRRAFLNGVDIHLNTAVGMTRRKPKLILPEERKMAKPVNFGYSYGMGERRFVEYAFDNYGVEVSPEDSHDHREAFFASYPQLLPWHRRQRRLVNQYGLVSSPFGRVRHLPQVWSGDKSVAGDAERQAINSPIQSCGSDLMLLSLVRLEQILPPREAFIVGTVHDAINFQVRTSELDRWLPVIRDIMQDTEDAKKKFGVAPDVPIEVEVKYGQHWSEGQVWSG